MKKILISTIVIILCVTLIILKENVNMKDDIYVVSNSENVEKETIHVKENNESENNIQNETIGKEDITIYISGEVINPGILIIESDKRLYDAVEKLGGVTEYADLNKVNLAIKLIDEQHYIIPKIGEDNDIVYQNQYINNDNTKDNKKVNINTATIQDLDTLPGVGEATANKIINYRDENKKFNSIEEIKNVNGIGDKKYEDIKELICVE